MDTSKILNQLSEKKFELKNPVFFDDTIFSFFSNEHINVVTCHYLNTNEIEKINMDAEFIREILHKHKINVWNTYLLISFSNEINTNFSYLIERNFKSMRRYVIKEEKDFMRIPFLDNTDTIANPFKLPVESKSNSSEKIKEIISFIDNNDGSNVTINKTEIEKKVQELMNLEG